MVEGHPWHPGSALVFVVLVVVVNDTSRRLPRAEWLAAKAHWKEITSSARAAAWNSRCERIIDPGGVEKDQLAAAERLTNLVSPPRLTLSRQLLLMANPSPPRPWSLSTASPRITPPFPQLLNVALKMITFTSSFTRPRGRMTFRAC